MKVYTLKKFNSFRVYLKNFNSGFFRHKIKNFYIKKVSVKSKKIFKWAEFLGIFTYNFYESYVVLL